MKPEQNEAWLAWPIRKNTATGDAAGELKRYRKRGYSPQCSLAVSQTRTNIMRVTFSPWRGGGITPSNFPEQCLEYQ
jgi:hypothetical protein